MPKQVLLKVFANPFCTLEDHEGRAHGHIQYEPSGNDGDAHLPFVGCHLIATAKAKGTDAKPKPGTKLHHVVRTGHADAADWDHVWEYDTEPTLVPLTPYYLSALRQHGHHGPALLPADLATYRLVHGTAELFRDPLERLHQYAAERTLIPQLKVTEVTAKARAAHAVKRTLDGSLPERDHEAEWHAFVGAPVVAKRAAWEASEPTHKNYVAPAPPAPPPAEVHVEHDLAPTPASDDVPPHHVDAQ